MHQTLKTVKYLYVYIHIYIGAVEIVCSDLGEGVSFVITTYWFLYLC